MIDSWPRLYTKLGMCNQIRLPQLSFLLQSARQPRLRACIYSNSLQPGSQQFIWARTCCHKHFPLLLLSFSLLPLLSRKKHKDSYL